jgi:hypothetical protein
MSFDLHHRIDHPISTSYEASTLHIWKKEAQYLMPP